MEKIQLNSDKLWEIIQFNYDKPWSYGMLSFNPNITWELVQTNNDRRWNYRGLSCNKMNKQREEFIRKRFQEWFRRSKLKEEIMANVWHPRNFEKFKYLDPDTFGEEF